jgi:hypothetical protein
MLIRGRALAAAPPGLYFALEPGGLYKFTMLAVGQRLLIFYLKPSSRAGFPLIAEQKARKKNNLPLRFNLTLCLDPE